MGIGDPCRIMIGLIAETLLAPLFVQKRRMSNLLSLFIRMKIFADCSTGSYQKDRGSRSNFFAMNPFTHSLHLINR
jgi:hypothetical protein